MSSWGNNDNAANTPLWAAASVKVEPTRSNVTDLFDNTTMNDWEVTTSGGTKELTNIAVGVFGVDANESDVSSTHTGWVLRTTGSGERAGRVQEEVLVALSSFNTGSDAEDTVYKDAIITISSQPATVRGPVSAASANTVSYAVTAAVTTGNTAAPLTYQWQVNNNAGGSWSNVTNTTYNGSGVAPNTIITGATTATLTVDPTNVDANNYVFRVVVSATGTGATATSANGRILITA